MLYKALYEHTQSYPARVGRNEIKNKALELRGVSSVRIVASDMDVALGRGYYLSPRNQSHRLSVQFGGHIIVVARQLNRCWTRFIVIKELMHLLSGNEEATDSGDKFEAVLATFSGPAPATLTPSIKDEIRAFWMALGALCPEHLRLALAASRERGHITDYGIALQLRIPELHVPKLLSSAYQTNIKRILE